MTNATALSAKLRDLGHRPLTTERAREWGGMSVHRTRGIGGDAQVSFHDGWRDHGVDAKASAEQVAKELADLGYQVDAVYGNEAYASFYVSGSPKPTPKPKKDPGKFTVTALRNVPNTYIVAFTHRTVWAVELSGDLKIEDFDPDNLRDNRWSIIGTVSDYQRVEGVHSGWIISVGEDYSDPIRNRDEAMKEWRQWLTRRYEERADEQFLREVREIELAMDAAIADDKSARLSDQWNRARNLSAAKFFEWKRLNRLSRTAHQDAMKQTYHQMLKTLERARALDDKARAIWEDVRVCDSLALFAAEALDEIWERRSA